MTREEMEQVIYRMYEAFNSRDINSVDDIFTQDFYSHPLQAGLEAVKKTWVSMFERFPDIRVVVEDLLVEGEKAASRTSIRGITAADAEKQPMILELIRVESQRIAEVWGLTNLGEVVGSKRKD
ncbi:putative ester cyclase [Paenibacillus sp. V4I3]|uniref:ester cyclase n=1 Tax=unclassified Paenibacillus TaxID=185978 RepID=UPI002780916E|nr:MULTISPECIES: ester cyclase [unclassified Paenibacillus]MDQ0876032.1 putative ester cyclase [Paenibacillus sp. V4I3]MDQ0888624.1 putative ester cyclase [Paenibacillus sp. V4I9]